MPEVTFIHPDGRTQTLTVPEHWSVLQIAQEHGIKSLEGICGGVMACATCHIYIHPDWMERVSAADNEKTEEEIDTLDTAFHVQQNSRLGCQVKITNALDGLIVLLPV